MTNTRNAPVEIIEATYPLMVRRYGLVSNSEGPGKFRGGMGMFREITFLEKETTLTISSDRNKIRPWGVFDGKSASPAQCRLVDSKGNDLEIPSKATLRVEKGDTMTTVTSGGGGWGNPYERDPEKVRWDVQEDLVSIERAQTEYGVILTGDPPEIVQEGTEETRGRKRKQQHEEESP